MVSCRIITAGCNALMQPIHECMPVFLLPLFKPLCGPDAGQGCLPGGEKSDESGAELVRSLV